MKYTKPFFNYKATRRILNAIKLSVSPPFLKGAEGI